MSGSIKTSYRVAVVLSIVLVVLLIGVVQGQYEPLGSGETTQLTAVIGANPETLDPATTYDITAFQITTHIYEPLVASNSAKGYQSSPGLAESWAVSSDGLTWTFNIRPGAKFHDGTDADASAVVYNIGRWWDPDHPYYVEDFIYFEYLFGGSKGDAASLISDVTAEDESTVTIRLNRRDSNILAKLTFPGFAIASPQAIQTQTLAGNPVGSGPYKFVKWQMDQYVELAANSEWPKMLQMDILRFKIIPTPTDRLQALASGQVQASDGLQSLLHEVKMAGSLNVKWHPANNSGYMGINRAHTPLDNLLVRQAIAHGVDRKSIIANYYTPGDMVAKDMIPPQLWGADPNLEDYIFDPALAVDLLTQAGYPNGFAITLSFRDAYRGYLPDPAATAAAIADDLQAIGIAVTVEELSSNDFFNELYGGELELFLLGWNCDYPHPYNLYAPTLCGDELGPRDDELCDTIDATVGATSFAAEEALFHKASRRAHEIIPVLPIAHGREPLVIYRDLFGASFFWSGADYTEALYADSHSYLPVTTGE